MIGFGSLAINTPTVSEIERIDVPLASVLRIMARLSAGNVVHMANIACLYPYANRSFQIKLRCDIGFPVIGSHMGGIGGSRSSK